MSILLTPTSNNFNFTFPTKLDFGCGNISKLPDYLKELDTESPLLVTGKTVSKLEPFKEMLRHLQENEITPHIWDGVIQDPTNENIREGATHYIENECDGLIAYGGGSPMDAAKSIGLLAYHGEDDIIKFIGQNARPIKEIPPFICIPTTSGTGSEVTNISVITYSPIGRKIFAINNALYPKVSIVDPDLCVTMPKSVTASTGMDALSHAIGCYTHANGGNPISDPLALYSMELISQNIKRAVDDGGDIEARTNMSLAATLAGIAFGNGGVHLEHSIGHMLGVKYHIPHGLGCVLLLPEILEFILPVKTDRLAVIARMLGADTKNMTKKRAAEMAIEKVFQLMNDVGIPSLSESTKATSEDVSQLAELAMKEMWSSPRTIEVKDYEEMFRKALAR